MWTLVQTNQFITIVMIIHHLKNSDEKTRKLLQMNQKIMIIRRTFSLFSKIFIFFLFFIFSYLNVYNKNNHLSLWLFSSFLILSISSCLLSRCQEPSFSNSLNSLQHSVKFISAQPLHAITPAIWKLRKLTNSQYIPLFCISCLQFFCFCFCRILKAK